MKTRTNLSLQRLNPDLPVEAIEGAVEEICRDRTALSLAEANREIERSDFLLVVGSLAF